MNSYTLLDPEPVTAVRILAGPVFSTREVAFEPKQPSGVVRRPVGKRNALSLAERSPHGDLADDEDEPMSESDGDIGFGDDEEDNETILSRTMKRSRSVDSTGTINPNKKLKISGGRAATHKDVTHILDSDDEIIYNMKHGGQKDGIIVQRLIDEGRTKYQEKTIATRYSRILLKMEEHAELQMEEEFSDFHEEDDIALQVAQEELQTWYQRQVDILQTKRWREVSKLVNAKLSKSKYSKKACQDRAEALADGTAIIPFEQDSDQEARRAQALQQIEQRKADRLAAVAEARRPLDERKKIKAEEDRLKREAKAEREEKAAQRAAEKAADQAKKDATKAERDRVRQAKLKQEELIKRQKQQELDEKKRTSEAAKAAKEKAKEDDRAAKQDAKMLAELSRAREGIQASEARYLALKAEASATTIMNMGMAEEMKKIITSTSPDITPTAPSTNKKKTTTKVTASATAKKPATPRSKSAKTKATAPSIPSSAVSKTPNKPKSTATKTKPSTSSLRTTPTNTGPIRASMTVSQLRVLSRSRGLVVTGKKEVLVQNLVRDDSMKTMDALNRVLVERKLACSGTKQDMIDRIAKDDVEKALAESKKTATV